MSRLRIAAVSLAFALAGCGGITPLEACKAQGKAACPKMWSCEGSSVKVGKDAASCVDSYAILCAFAPAGGCEDGKTFVPAKAEACIKDIEAATCDTYKDSSYAAANCSQQCK